MQTAHLAFASLLRTSKPRSASSAWDRSRQIKAGSTPLVVGGLAVPGRHGLFGLAPEVGGEIDA